MAKHYVKHRDAKGTLARVERNVRIARHNGMRLAQGGKPLEVADRDHMGEWRFWSTVEERQARTELSPGLWLASFTTGWDMGHGG